MFIKEFASSLNLMGILSHSEDYGLSSLTREYGIKYVSKIRRGKSGPFRMVNVPRIAGMPEAAIKKLNDIGTYYGDGWYVLVEKIDPVYVKFFTNLIEIPSVVIDSIITVEGVERIYFRAHEKDRNKITDLVYKSNLAPESMYLERLDKNPGLVEIMKTFDSDIRLSYLEFKMKVPPAAMEVEKDPVISTFGNNWIREVKYLLDENAHAVYYEKSKILRASPGIQEISRDDNIYRMNYSNPVITYLVNEATSQNVGLMSLAQRMLGRDFHLSFIVPKMCMPRVNKIMSALMQKYPNWDITVTMVKDIHES